MSTSGHGSEVRRAFTRQAGAYNASAVANAGELLDALVDAAGPRPGEHWLEAACGPGIVARRFAPLVGSVHGVDLTEAMIDTARREAASAGLANATFEVGDATATALPDASADGAVTRFSVHHVPVPVRLLAELARVVRPGGRVVVLDHLCDEDGGARAWSAEIERLRDPSHWASLTASELRGLGRDAGLGLASERRLGFELDFDDWLRRGTDHPAAHALVERALATRPGGSECFAVRPSADGRVLALQMWLGVWSVPAPDC